MFGNCSVSPGISNSFFVQEYEQRYKCNQQSNWRKIFDETKTGWWRQWAAMQERGSDNEGAGRRNLLGKSFCLPSVFTRQPHLPSAPAPASPSDLKAHLLWPGGSCECFFDLVNDDFEVNIVKAMQREKKKVFCRPQNNFKFAFSV